ncbi:glutamine amidotransferase-related protein [Schaalia suimastitidis]|uniref:glutamine amidotransferase-related protein n=1 Tax=Schaalia suimastitidis TaxID=121163 RepID=UPI0004087400|nr:aminotransferase class IV [Schaalia suimastitidis]
MTKHVFHDSFLVRQGRVAGLDRHIRRLATSAALPEVTLRATYQAILGEIAAQDRWAFPLVTACDGYVSYDLRFMSPTALDDTATLWTYPNVDPRTLPHFKGPDFPIQKSLREQAQSHGANEAVLLGADGVVREGAFSAIVHWVDGTLVLAPRDGRMPSVTEELVTEIAREKGIQVVVRGASPCEVASADEVWCLSSLHGIRVVTAWDAMPVRHAGIAEDFRTALRAKEVAISTLREIGITPMLERCRVLLVDNYDSFTYNLAHLVAACTGKEPHVVRNDTELDDIDLDRYTHIIFSPGPGSPEEGADVGICAQILEVATVPILGVCLGHQLIAHICGARIERAPQPMHGRRSTVRHQGEGLFEGVPKDFQVVRYHSLAATSLPSVLQMSAVSDDGVVMAFRHRERPLWGVQFHPESILTEYGATILRNFLSMPTTHSLASEPPHAGTQLAWHCEQGFPSEQRIGGQDREGAQGDDTAQASECSQDHESALAEAAGCEPQPVLPHIPAPTRTWRIERRHLGLGHDPETIFRALYGADHHSFWLDSNSGDQRCQLSIMGSCDGKYAHTLRYQADSGNTLCETSDGRTQKIAADIFTLIHTTLAAYGRLRKESSVHGFMLGYVGYLGYGLKGDTCGVADPKGLTF